MSAEALEIQSRREPAFGRSFALAVAVHAALIAVMFVGVRWQSHRPETVTVELWDAPPPPPPAAEAPPPPPKAAPEPPKPEPKIEKPQIVEKAPPPKPKPEPKPKPKPKPEAKVEKAKPKPDPKFLKQMQEEAAREQKALDEQSRAREARDAKARAAAAASKKAVDEWVGKIRASVRGRVIEPPGITGNPEVVFLVALLPSGDVIPESMRMTKGSGNKAWDMAVERAILAASPLPKPNDPSVFKRELELRVKPKDQ